MTLPEKITLTADEEAARLWKGAMEAFEQASESFVSLCEALDLGTRAVEIVAIQRLREAVSRFPATIASEMEVPEPTVIVRDALTVPHSLDLTDVVDLLSVDELDCVSPHLHRGWEDRRTSCLRARGLARETAGWSIPAAARDKLLLLAAYRNRIFRSPPPVEIETVKILDAFPALTKLYEQLTR